MSTKALSLQPAVTATILFDWGWFKGLAITTLSNFANDGSEARYQSSQAATAFKYPSVIVGGAS